MIKSLCFFILVAGVVSNESIGESMDVIRIDEDYIVSISTARYIQAFATCKLYGKTLVTERNEAETLKFNNVLNDAGLSGRSYWLGGIYQRDVEFTPEWIWLDSGVVFNYTNWYSTPSTSDYCLRKYPSATYSGKWVADSCASEYYFACKNI
ncbi:uncharacterized protein LOC143200175 [Rhynchophorus ferrugineus]|uniref:uncharacterized protein LOC143200175 n=1 Tax=Rhynchophorus ferrugineus TaxID=354439 RepID=UPI003FCDF3F9